MPDTILGADTKMNKRGNPLLLWWEEKDRRYVTEFTSNKAISDSSMCSERNRLMGRPRQRGEVERQLGKASQRRRHLRLKRWRGKWAYAWQRLGLTPDSSYIKENSGSKRWKSTSCPRNAYELDEWLLNKTQPILGFCDSLLLPAALHRSRSFPKAAQLNWAEEGTFPGLQSGWLSSLCWCWHEFCS